MKGACRLPARSRFRNCRIRRRRRKRCPDSRSSCGTASSRRPAWTRRWWRASTPIFNQVLETPAVRNAINVSQAAEAVGGPAAQFDALIKAELKRWPEVVKAAGIKAE